MKLELGYWNIRGLAAPARMMLYYSGMDYTDTTFSPVKNEDGTWGYGSWFVDRKPQIQKVNPYANLPFICHDEKVITQSNAVYQYIGRLTSLCGKSEEEIEKNEQTLCQVFDLRNAVVGVAYNNAQYDQNMPIHFSKTVPAHYKKFNNWLEVNGTDFFSGSEPLTADFHVWEMLDQHQGWAKDAGIADPLRNFAALQKFYDRFARLEKMKSYFTSEVSKLSYNNVSAAFIAPKA